MLEAGLYKDNAFVTLTYGDDPYTLKPEDHRNFMKRLRHRLAPVTVRFYCVGEYGEKMTDRTTTTHSLDTRAAELGTWRLRFANYAIIIAAPPVIFCAKCGAKASSKISRWKWVRRAMWRATS